MSSPTTEIALREVPFPSVWRGVGGTLRALERWCARFARRKALAACAVAAATILLRLSLLPVLPVPTPTVHDEFSYLLAGDTFAHGRLTNPPHPMAQYLETFHVNQHPTYMSKYPPAQGAVLAFGELLGNPWIGVLLSAAGLCAAVTWMLQGWVPAEWALLGGTLVMLRFGLYGYWINSYWGGAVAAIGGALVLGAIPRIVHSARSRDAIILGLGAGILANSRPFEGLLLCLPAFAFLGFKLLTKKAKRNEILSKVLLPLCATGLLCVIFMGYYNWRGTGKATLFPYSLNDQTYMSTPAFIWEKLLPPRQYSNPQFSAFYNGFARVTWAQGHVDSVGAFFAMLKRDSVIFLNYFLWPELCLPLLAIPFFLRDRNIRVFLAIFCVSALAWPLVVWFQPHYAAPLTAVVALLVVQAMRHIRQWHIRSLPLGPAITRLLFLAAVLLVPFHMDWETPLPNRGALEQKLRATPGQHLVIVRYSPQHDPIFDWVYNGADIDHAKIVWAREIPGASDKPLIDYFQGRQVWLVQPDAPHASQAH